MPTTPANGLSNGFVYTQVGGWHLGVGCMEMMHLGAAEYDANSGRRHPKMVPQTLTPLHTQLVASHH